MYKRQVEKARAVEQRHRESIQMYYKAGGRIALGTDAGTPFNLHGDNAMELAYMVEFGTVSYTHLADSPGLLNAFGVGTSGAFPASCVSLSSKAACTYGGTK